MRKSTTFIIFSVAAGIMALATPGAAQEQGIAIDVTKLEQWELPASGADVVEYKGAQALQIKPGPKDRLAILKDCDFTDGVIEADIAAIPFFAGVAFRVKSKDVYEAFYFRPQNSHHTDPARRGHTLQYVASPHCTWFFLREKYPEQYEAGADLAMGEWFHVKIEVRGASAKVFVNNEDTPRLVVDDLKHGLSRGSVALMVGNTSGGTFTNLKITPLPPAQPIESYSGTVAYAPEQDFLFDVFEIRRSVRKFKPTPVPQEHVLRILDIARTAPTAGNQQPWKFLVIQDRDKIDRLRDECVAASLNRAKQNGETDPQKLEELKKSSEQRLDGGYLSAPVYVVVLVDKNSQYPSYNVYDGTLAAGYLIIAARALGYGTVFITDSIPEDILMRVLEIPDNFQRICFIPIGVPEQWPDPPSKKDLDEFVAFEKLIRGVNFTVPIKKEAVKLDPAVLQEYAGEYGIGEEGTMTIRVDGERVTVQATGQAPLEIFPEAKDKFFLKEAPVEITFLRTDGKVTGLKIVQGTTERTAEKVKD